MESIEDRIDEDRMGGYGRGRGIHLVEWDMEFHFSRVPFLSPRQQLTRIRGLHDIGTR